MNLTLTSISRMLCRCLHGRPGVRIEERRWRRSIAALHRDCEGLKRRIDGCQWSAQRR